MGGSIKDLRGTLKIIQMKLLKLVAIAAVLSGCATANSLVEARNEGVKDGYGAGVETGIRVGFSEGLTWGNNDCEGKLKSRDVEWMRYTHQTVLPKEMQEINVRGTK